MYYIIDCNRKLAGNPKGYRTHRGAEHQCNANTRIRTELWNKFYQREDKSIRTVYRIVGEALLQENLR